MWYPSGMSHRSLLAAAALLLTGCTHSYRFSNEAVLGFDGFPPAVPSRGQAATLPSGLRVVTYQVEGDRDAELLLTFSVGRLVEPPGKEGVGALAARLLEAASRPARRGVATLYTRGVVTRWRLNLDELELGAWCKTDQLGETVRDLSRLLEDPGAGLTEVEVAERREQLADELDRVADGFRQQSNLVLARAFAGTIYGRVPPTPESIRGLTRQDVRDYLKAVARPERAVLAVVSGMPPEQSLREASQGLSAIALGDQASPVEPVAAIPVTSPVAKAVGVETVPLRTDERRLWVAWAIPGEGDTMGPSAQVAAMFLEAEAVKRLRKEKLLGKGKRVSTTTWLADGIMALSIAVPLQRREDAERARDIVQQSMEVARSRSTEPFFKNYGPRKVSLSRYYGTEGRPDLEQVARSMRIAGEPDPNVRFNAAVRSQAGNLLKYSLASWQRRGPAAVVLFEPTGGTVAPPPDRLQGGVKWSSRDVLRPDQGQTPAIEVVRGRFDPPGLDAAERFTLGNGLRLAVLPRKGSPFVKIGLALPGANSPSEVARANAAIRAASAKLPAGCNTGLDLVWTAGSEFYLSTRRSGLRYVMEVLACWTTAAEVDGVKSQTKPVEAAWLRALDEATLAAPPAPLDLAPEWGGRWFRRTFRPAGATLVVVGDVSPTEVHAMATAVFSAWREPDGSRPVLAPTILPPPAARTVVVADYPEAFAGWIEVMIRRQGAPAVTAPEQELLAWILADRLQGRLPGGEYHVRVRPVDSGPLPGLLVVVEGRTDRLVPNLAQVLELLTHLDRDVADPAQLATARWNAVRRRTFAFSRTGSTTSELVQLHMLELPPEGFEKLGDQYAVVSAERLRAAWARYAVGREGVLVAAPWEVVNPQLQGLGLSPTRAVPVERLDEEVAGGGDEE